MNDKFKNIEWWLDRWWLEDYQEDRNYLITKKPTFAEDHHTKFAHEMQLGNWILGIYTDFENNLPTVGCGVICNRPDYLPESPSGKLLYFLPEGNKYVRPMQMCDIWYYSPQRPAYVYHNAYDFDMSYTRTGRLKLEDTLLLTASELHGAINRSNKEMLTANELPTHWHCADCGENNNFDQHPRRCGTCRRYKQ